MKTLLSNAPHSEEHGHSRRHSRSSRTASAQLGAYAHGSRNAKRQGAGDKGPTTQVKQHLGYSKK